MADLFHLSPEDRRMMVAIGIGTGIGSIFKALLEERFLLEKYYI
ncbi:MAG: hypothetical protein ACPLSP_04430 [Fervidicoccus fontis]